MIISGPILALSIACGSFLIICGSVMTVKHAKPEILTTAHYPNIEIYGHEAEASANNGVSPQKAKEFIASKGQKDFVCSLKNEKNNTFDCHLEKSEEPKILKNQQDPKCKMPTPEKEIYKITADRKNTSQLKTEKEFYIWIIDKKEKDQSKKIQSQYAKIKSLFLVDVDKVECAS